MLDLPILTALCAIIVTAAALVVDAIQTRSIRKINSKVEAFQQQDIGASFGEWLLASEKTEDGKEITNLESMASLVGRQIAGSFKMGLQGIASGEARTIRAVEGKVIEALQTPESKALLEFADRAGIPKELAGVIYDIAERRGLLPQILKNNGQGSGESRSW